MAQWYVKNLSKLTNVSVQTLHHYDHIGLLKPSLRLPNGYRIYSETDLLRLQQIIALKFFGFELSQIKALLASPKGAVEHFQDQAQFLEQKANRMLDASRVLKQAISDVEGDQSIPWETIIKVIELYKMTEKLEESWVKEIFTPEELKEYVTFKTELEQNATPQQKAEFEKSWADMVDEMTQNLHNDPASPIGIAMGKKCMDWVNGVYGKKYAHLRTKKFEKGYGEGKGLDQVGLTPEIVSWLDKAMDAYWRTRIHSILNQIGSHTPDAAILKLWKEALDEMYGEQESRKKEIYELVFADKEVSQVAKEWLRKQT